MKMIGENLVTQDASVPVEIPWEDTAPMSLDILLVEDEVPFRQVIARNLAGRGHRVREASTASEAIQMALDSSPDLMLLDINLPDRSGLDVLRELRRQGSEVPTILVSAVRVSPARLAEFRPLAYLPKPFPLEALLRVVEETPEQADRAKARDPKLPPLGKGD
jgi:DNA-binding response OmpR family regulator